MHTQLTNDPAYTKAYEETRGQLEAMPESDIEPIRYDVMAAVITGLGTVPNARNLRRRVKARFGDAAEATLGDLGVAARALGKVHGDHLAQLHGADVEEIAGQLAAMRGLLLLEVQALVARGALAPSVVAELVGGTSYKGLCLDVLQLTSVLRRGWAEIEALTGVTLEEIDRAETLANVLSTTLGENEVGSVPSKSADMRRRAYTRFVRLYDEHRRYATYFRWKEEDADELFPPLGAGRKKSDDDDVEAPPVASSAVQVRPGMPGAPPFAT